MSRSAFSAAALLALAVGTSCASEQKKPDASVAQATAPAKPADAAKEVPPEVAQLIANFQRVYFDLDKSDINADTQSALAANAEILAKRLDVKVEIQGHADERGTNEYNLALGDKRAQAVRDYLTRAGIDGARLTTISYGEERPVDGASTETGWSKNRRAEFRVTWGDAVGTAAK